MRRAPVFFFLILFLLVGTLSSAEEWEEEWTECPANSHWNGLECRCNDGYASTGDSCITPNAYCLRIDSNSHYNSVTQNCDCNTHYAPVDGSCVHGSVLCPRYNAHYNAAIEDCECAEGYEEVNNYCEPVAPVVCGANEHNDGNGNCVCDSGYTVYTASVGCEAIACPSHSHYDSGEGDCVCDNGYELVGGDCVEPAPEPVDSPEDLVDEELAEPEEEPAVEAEPEEPSRTEDPREDEAETPAAEQELADEEEPEPAPAAVEDPAADEEAVVEQAADEAPVVTQDQPALVDEPGQTEPTQEKATPGTREDDTATEAPAEKPKETILQKILPKKNDVPEEPEMEDVKPPEEKKQTLKEVENYQEKDLVTVPIPLQQHALKLAEEKEPDEILQAYETTKTVSKLQEKNGINPEKPVIPITVAQEAVAAFKKDLNDEDKEKFEVANALLNAKKGVEKYEADQESWSNVFKSEKTKKKEKEIYKKQKAFLENDADLIQNTGNALYFSETKTREYDEKLAKIKEVKENAEFRMLFKDVENGKVEKVKDILKYKKRLEKISKSDTKFGKSAKAILEKANELEQYATDKAWLEETLKASGHGDKATALKREETLQKLDDEGVNVLKEVGNHILNNELDGNVKLLYDTYNNAQTNKEQFTGGPQDDIATGMQVMVDLGGVAYGATAGGMAATTGGAMAVYGVAAKKMVEATAKIDQEALKKLDEAKVGVDLRKSHPINTFLDKHGDEKEEGTSKVTTLKFKDPRTGVVVEEKIIRGATAFVKNPGTGMLLPADPDTLRITGKYQYKFVKGTPLCPWCDGDHIEVYTLDGKKVEEEFDL
jgi:hypothetical protein